MKHEQHILHGAIANLKTAIAHYERKVKEVSALTDEQVSVLNLMLTDLDLKNSVTSPLVHDGIETISAAINKGYWGLLKTPNFGLTRLKQLIKALAAKGINFYRTGYHFMTPMEYDENE